METLILLGALFLAFTNGANDNFKGVATLYGSGELAYRPAILLGTGATALGGFVSLFAAQALAHAFSAKGLVPDAALSDAFLAAVALGAAATVLLATRLGFPVSTTHALVGGLTGAGFAASGPELNVQALGGAFALPLLASPVVATGLATLGLRAMRLRGSAATKAATSPGVRRGHLISAGLVSFARGLNDTPKILGLLIGASVVTVKVGVGLIILAMAAGGLVAARRVAETLAQRITPMSPLQGLIGNATTAVLVIGASGLGFPVSTTHVSTGGIFGIGADSGSLRWGSVGSILAGWLTTLPVAAVLSAGALWVLR